MSAVVENPAKCEVRGVIRFLWLKSYTATEIHRELSAVYDPNIMNEGVVRQWALPKRPQFCSFEKFHSELKGVFPDLTSQSKEVPDIIETSLYIPNKSRVLWTKAFELFQNRQ
ncbi:hypothetical protein J6590_025405 [Homalodisca vitripennis]|nr:hypothetical protein J6590_025405 [Homalodisca vitripennis]